MGRAIGLKETDLAHLVRAKFALKDLHALSIRLCYKRPTENDIIELRDNIAKISAALELMTLWLGPQTSPQILAWLEALDTGDPQSPPPT